MNIKKYFGSDNFAGAHPSVLKAIVDANSGYEESYGADQYTQAAIKILKEQFGPACDIYFLLTGTGANVIGLATVTHPFHSILCAQSAHINIDECGAVSQFTGCTLVPIPTVDGKLTIESIEPFVHGFSNQHHSQPRVVSISQSTEWGTVYTPSEILKLARFCHRHDMLLHVDGSRLANAAVSLGVELREITLDAGVDILSLGGTKNGLLMGEALIFFSPALAENCKYFRKQGMQLSSKMRFIGAQFTALYTDDLWRKNAATANRMARLLMSEIESITGLRLAQKVEANALFIEMPPELLKPLCEEFLIYVWDERASIVRLMCSFATTQQEIASLIETIKRLVPDTHSHTPSRPHQ